jgi:hypothetical protein
MNTIDLLSDLLEKPATDDPRGKCTWTDSNGVDRCNNFSQFQCQQVSRTWDPNDSCEDTAKAH